MLPSVGRVPLVWIELTSLSLRAPSRASVVDAAAKVEEVATVGELPGEVMVCGTPAPEGAKRDAPKKVSWRLHLCREQRRSMANPSSKSTVTIGENKFNALSV